MSATALVPFDPFQRARADMDRVGISPSETAQGSRSFEGTGPLPTLEEVPVLPTGWIRDLDALVNLSMLPHDDGDLRALAVKEFMTSERDGNTVGRLPEGADEAYQKILWDLSHTPARTPGGLAWKLGEVLKCLTIEIEAEGESWCWWHHLVQSAMIDALELERARQATITASRMGVTA